MSAGFLGMDVQAVRDSATRIRNAADQVQQSIDTTQAAVDSAKASWQGTDADNFVSYWETEKPKLIALKTWLEGAAQSADNNASAQEQVSGS